MQTEPHNLKPDAKGRIALGKLADGVSRCKVQVDRKGRIILEPYAEIPMREKWLFDNPDALGSLKQGLKESASGKTKHRGSFARHAKS